MDPQTTVGYFGIEVGMRVADFGSGAGYFTILLARLVGETGLVTAIDVMDYDLDIVRARAKTEGLRNIDTVRSNLEVVGGSGLASESQDFVLLKNVLFQTNNKEQMVNEANRVLKAGGAMVVIDWKKGVDGLGPPDDLRTDAEAVRRVVGEAGFEYARPLEPDNFHYGLVFKKLGKLKP